MSGTPTPWKLGSHRGFGTEHDIEGPDGQDMSGIRGMFYHREDAERAVRAVNSHDELLSSLKTLISQIDRWQESVKRIVQVPPDYEWGDLEEARAAVARAESGGS